MISIRALQARHRRKLSQLRGFVRDGNMSQYFCADLDLEYVMEEPTRVALVWGRELVAAFSQEYGASAERTLRARARVCHAFLKFARQRGSEADGGDPKVLGELGQWLDAYERESAPHESEALRMLAFELWADPIHDGDASLMVAGRALALATTKEARVKAQTQVGRALRELKRYEEAERALADAAGSNAADETRWWAAYELAQAASDAGRKDVQIARLIALFDDMETKNALTTELCRELVADTLLHELRGDPRVDDLQRRFDHAFDEPAASGPRAQ